MIVFSDLERIMILLKVRVEYSCIKCGILESFQATVEAVA